MNVFLAIIDKVRAGKVGKIGEICSVISRFPRRLGNTAIFSRASENFNLISFL